MSVCFLVGCRSTWGFVAGKTQTYLPWDSWQRPHVLIRPPAWFHAIYHPDGMPYRQREVELIHELTATSNMTGKTGDRSEERTAKTLAADYFGSPVAFVP
jgi:hypothetical protein